MIGLDAAVAARDAHVDQVPERSPEHEGRTVRTTGWSAMQANGAPHGRSVTATGPPGPPPGTPTSATVGSAEVATGSPWLHCVASLSHVTELDGGDVAGHEVGARRADRGRDVERVVAAACRRRATSPRSASWIVVSAPTCGVFVTISTAARRRRSATSPSAHVTDAGARRCMEGSDAARDERLAGSERVR